MLNQNKNINIHKYKFEVGDARRRSILNFSFILKNAEILQIQKGFFLINDRITYAEMIVFNSILGKVILSSDKFMGHFLKHLPDIEITSEFLIHKKEDKGTSNHLPFAYTRNSNFGFNQESQYKIIKIDNLRKDDLTFEKSPGVLKTIQIYSLTSFSTISMVVSSPQEQLKYYEASQRNLQNFRFEVSRGHSPAIIPKVPKPRFPFPDKNSKSPIVLTDLEEFEVEYERFPIQMNNKSYYVAKVYAIEGFRHVLFEEPGSLFYFKYCLEELAKTCNRLGFGIRVDNAYLNLDANGTIYYKFKKRHIEDFVIRVFYDRDKEIRVSSDKTFIESKFDSFKKMGKLSKEIMDLISYCGMMCEEENQIHYDENLFSAKDKYDYFAFAETGKSKFWKWILTDLKKGKKQSGWQSNNRPNNGVYFQENSRNHFKFRKSVNLNEQRSLKYGCFARMPINQRQTVKKESEIFLPGTLISPKKSSRSDGSEERSFKKGIFPIENFDNFYKRGKKPNTFAFDKQGGKKKITDVVAGIYSQLDSLV